MPRKAVTSIYLDVILSGNAPDAKGGYYGSVTARLKEALDRWDKGAGTHVAYSDNTGWYDPELKPPN